MNSKALLVTSLVLSVVASCAQLRTDVPQALAECTPVSSLVDTASDMLGGQDYQSALKDLADREGLNAVKCAVEFVRKRLMRAGAGADGASEFDAAKLANANAFLESTP